MVFGALVIKCPYFSKNQTLAPPCQDLAVRDAFEAAPQGVALGHGRPDKGSAVVADLQPIVFFLCCLMFMLNHYMIHDWVL